jgi:hypothetical protein
MSTRILSRAFLCAGLSVGFAGCATVASPRMADPAFDLQGGGHLQIVSGYLRDEPSAVVRGFVRRELLWRGPVDGHLHVTAYAAYGAVVARQTAVWSGPFGGRYPAPKPYQADLKVPRAEVARVAVAFAPGRHTASEPFK